MKMPGTVLYRAFQRGIQNPQIRPWLIVGTLAYVLSPIDLLPSFFLGIGEIDDLVLLSVLVTELFKLWMTQVPTVKSSDPAADSSIIDVEAVVDPEI
jgi:uncharacterized membrane protein YkvA (DUF1232 family)